MKPDRFLRRFFLSLAGAGFIKGAPGTYASFFTCFLLYCFTPYEWYFLFLPFFAISILCYLFSRSETTAEAEDPAWIVADEAAGQLLVFTTPFIPQDLLWYAAGFLLFRFFDISKPYPISALNEKKGAWYILCDDLLAGIFAGIALHLLFWAYFVISFFAVGSSVTASH